jgi:hypothetical protein
MSGRKLLDPATYQYIFAKLVFYYKNLIAITFPCSKLSHLQSVRYCGEKNCRSIYTAQTSYVCVCVCVCVCVWKVDRMYLLSERASQGAM